MLLGNWCQSGQLYSGCQRATLAMMNGVWSHGSKPTSNHKVWSGNGNVIFFVIANCNL